MTAASITTVCDCTVGWVEFRRALCAVLDVSDWTTVTDEGTPSS